MVGGWFGAYWTARGLGGTLLGHPLARERGRDGCWGATLGRRCCSSGVCSQCCCYTRGVGRPTTLGATVTASTSVCRRRLGLFRLVDRARSFVTHESGSRTRRRHQGDPLRDHE
jgi:hypothetical protein